MDGEGQLERYALLAARLKQAHALVRAAALPDDLRAAMTRKLLVITAASRHDADAACARLDRFIRDFGEGRLPGPGPG